jgi:hypothetical protein
MGSYEADDEDGEDMELLHRLLYTRVIERLCTFASYARLHKSCFRKDFVPIVLRR